MTHDSSMTTTAPVLRNRSREWLSQQASVVRYIIKSMDSQKACPLFNDILPLIVSNLLKVNVMVI